jgi:hypothetical protein
MRGIRSSSDEVKEVYAHFGLAYYHSEVLHTGLCNLYALSQTPAEGGMTRPRMEEHLSEAFSSTLGRIFNLVLPVLPENLVDKFKSAIDLRNFLAHRFWFERIHLTTTSEGVDRLVSELSNYSEAFLELDTEIDKLTGQYHKRLGLPDEMFQESLRAVMRGEDFDPLLQQRRLRKEEEVVAVYEVPMPGGASALIFKTKDGVLWQLCDAGLGWTFYDQVGADWKPLESVQEKLPARIDPRPKIRKPWHYEISFKADFVLFVRPGPTRHTFRWGVKKKGA